MGVPPTPQPMACFLRAGASWHRHMILVLPLIWISFTHPATASDLDLSLKEAIEIALSQDGSAEVQMAAESIREVQARSQQSRAELLPHLGASIGYQNQTRNLEALGLQPSPLFRPPTRVGPFTTFDARANLTQTIFNLGSIRRFQASKSVSRWHRQRRKTLRSEPLLRWPDSIWRPFATGLAWMQPEPT